MNHMELLKMIGRFPGALNDIPCDPRARIGRKTKPNPKKKVARKKAKNSRRRNRR